MRLQSIVSHPFHGQCQILIPRMLWHSAIICIIFTESPNKNLYGHFSILVTSFTICINTTLSGVHCPGSSHQSECERHASRLHCPAAISWLGTDSSQPEPVSKLHSTLSPLTLHTPSDWSGRHIPASDWLTRPHVITQELLSQDTHTRHNQVLSPPHPSLRTLKRWISPKSAKAIMELTKVEWIKH